MSKNNGGPAFPELYWSISEPGGPVRTMAEGGMSLRDYFAAKAMQGRIAGCMAEKYTDDFDDWARDAYAIADAMLKARNDA